MRKIILLLIVVIICSTWTFCDDTNSLIKDQLDHTNLNSLQQYIDKINYEADGFIPTLNAKEMILSILSRDPSSSIGDILVGLIKIFLKEIIVNLELLGKIIVLSVFCAFLQNLHGAFESESISKLAYNICYVLIIILSIKSFQVAMNLGVSTIESMVSFMQSLLPMLMSLLVSVGGFASAAVFQPIIFASISFIATIIKSIIVPFLYFSVVLSILNNISDKVHISKLSNLFKQISIGVLGILMTVFIGIITVKGVASSSLDGVTAQTAKFALDSFVPVVGGFLSNAFDTVISCSMLIKNGVSIAALIVIVILCAIPLIKMLSIIVIYKVSCALIQPVIDNEIVQCLNEMGNTLFLMFACLTGVGIMFFVAITVIMGTGNMTVMMR